MDTDSERIAAINPDLIHRTCGGWLAVSPRGTGLSLGVTAPSKEKAREKFRYVLARWLEILTEKTLDVPK
jgi:hypothetical protein